MDCEKCGEAAATVHLTTVTEEETIHCHLCEPCAQKLGTHMESADGLVAMIKSGTLSARSRPNWRRRLVGFMGRIFRRGR